MFEGTAGTVTLGANVTMAGLQFVITGYLITSTNDSTITAATGTILEANSGVSGTIGVGIVGAGDVTVSGPGTVILTAANTYTGGTTIIVAASCSWATGAVRAASTARLPITAS